ncbi:hypothetical protein LSUCC0246_09995 [Rhodobacterales bacterium LSUCC0246]|nr:hypothetical protein [Rhodobacterales bacterium LSUCC0374]
MSENSQNNVDILDVFGAIASGWKVVLTAALLGLVGSLLFVSIVRKDTIVSLDLYPAQAQDRVHLDKLSTDALLLFSSLSGLVDANIVATFSPQRTLNIFTQNLIYEFSDEASFSRSVSRGEGERIVVDVASTPNRLPTITTDGEEPAVWRVTVAASNLERALETLGVISLASSDRTSSLIADRIQRDREFIQAALSAQNYLETAQARNLLNYYKLQREIAQSRSIDVPLNYNVPSHDPEGRFVPNYRDGLSVLNFYIDDISEQSLENLGTSPQSETFVGENFYLAPEVELDLGSTAYYSTPLAPIVSYSRNDALFVLAVSVLFGLFGCIAALVRYFTGRSSPR